MKKVTTSLLMWESQATFLQEVAQSEGMNLSQFVRDRIIPMLAQKYGRPAPEVPLHSRPPAVSQSGLHKIKTEELEALATALLKELKRR